MPKFLLLMIIACQWPVAMAQVVREKSIPYVPVNQKGFDRKRNTMDIFHVSDSVPNKPVLIFIHGGSWGSGNKNIYKAMGRNLVKKGFVSVIINYRLAPKVQYTAMISDCTKAVMWVYQNITQYGGNPDQITLAGHSAGAHLSASIAFKKTYEKWNIGNPIQQLILLDPFGLDMVQFFNEHNTRYSRSLYKVFTPSPTQWKMASPLYDIDDTIETPVRILVGSKTYKVIQQQSKVFYDSLQYHRVPSQYQIVKGKRHIGMITQFFRQNSKAFAILLEGDTAN